ncbi:hypothetical protein [Stanieria cyanosphaera]|nr:hypothetical protein [Stanieria cyanosphaera]
MEHDLILSDAKLTQAIANFTEFLCMIFAKIFLIGKIDLIAISY